MIVKLLTEHHFGFKLNRRLQRLVPIYTCQKSNCWKSHARAQLIYLFLVDDGRGDPYTIPL